MRRRGRRSSCCGVVDPSAASGHDSTGPEPSSESPGWTDEEAAADAGARDDEPGDGSDAPADETGDASEEAEDDDDDAMFEPSGDRSVDGRLPVSRACG